MWEKSLSLLKTKVNEQTFSTWFLPIKELSCEASTITLSAPNKFFENWIRDNYLSLIRASLLESSGIEFTVNFQVVTQEDSAAAATSQDNQKADAKQEQKGESKGWFKTMFGSSRQLPESQYQEIGLNPKYTFDQFVVGASNRFAHAAALAVSENPAKNYNPFFIHGGVGLGKTHLLQAIGHQALKSYPKAKILYISSEEFTNQLIHAIRTKTTTDFRNRYRNLDILLIDDIQFIAGKESTQEEFFHTFNRLYDSHKQIVLSSDRSPKEISELEERLISRFAWGLIADMQVPDFETRIAIIEKKCETESAPVPQDVLFFLAEKIKTNIREMEGALIRVVAYSKLTGKNLTVDLAKEVLKGMIIEGERKLTINQIQQMVTDYFGISMDDMKSKRRTQAIAFPRQIAMFLSRELTDHSLPYIGEHFGGRDHTTVLHAYEKIKKEVKINDNTGYIVGELTSKMKK